MIQKNTGLTNQSTYYRLIIYFESIRYRPKSRYPGVAKKPPQAFAGEQLREQGDKCVRERFDMGDYKLAAADERFAEIIWEREPLGSPELVKICEM